MTSKTQAILAAWVASIAGFINWLATVPPEQQNALVGPIVEVLPLSWRPFIGLLTRAVISASILFGLYKASHSGPQTPPTNSPLK